MIIRFTKENWNRFFTHSKKSTFRIKHKEVGHYDAYGGSYYKPVRYGSLDIIKVEERLFDNLTEQDAKDDGFDSLEELKREIKRLNKVNDKTMLYKYWVENVKGDIER